MAQRAAAGALFARRGGIMTGSLEGVDRELLYPAITAVLHNQDGQTRGEVAPIFGKLTDRDIAVLLPEVIQAVQKMAPSGEMFADGIRLAGLDLLSRLGIREGMELCLVVLEPDRWGSGKRLPKCLDSLTRYGTHAKAVLPQLKETRDELVRQSRGRPNEGVTRIEQAIAAIESSTASPTLIGLEDFVKKHTAVR
jgi:hypothetical protein